MSKKKYETEEWKVGVVGVSGRPIEWYNKKTKHHIRIDIHNPDYDNRCYDIADFDDVPGFHKSKKVLGKGCAIDPTESWEGAWEHSFEIVKKKIGLK